MKKAIAELEKYCQKPKVYISVEREKEVINLMHYLFILTPNKFSRLQGILNEKFGMSRDVI